MSSTFYNTEQQTIESVTKLLTAHGYDPNEYDVEQIAADYLHEPGLYNSVYANPSYVWSNLKEQQLTATKTRHDMLKDLGDLLAITTKLQPSRDPAAYDVGAIVTDFHDTYGHYNIVAPGIGSHDLFEIINKHYLTDLAARPE